MARLVLDVPVVRQLLQRYEDVIPVPRGGARDVAEHGQEEGIDLGVGAAGFVKKQQRDRVALVRPQAGRVAVDEVVQLLRDSLYAVARFLAHERAVSQRA